MPDARLTRVRVASGIALNDLFATVRLRAGQSSGLVPPFDIGVLNAKGSLFLTRPTSMTYMAKRADLLAAAKELFDVVGQGKIKIEIKQTFPLKDTAAAHRALEARQTIGSSVLIP